MPIYGINSPLFTRDLACALILIMCLFPTNQGDLGDTMIQILCLLLSLLPLSGPGRKSGGWDTVLFNKCLMGLS